MASAGEGKENARRAGGSGPTSRLPPRPAAGVAARWPWRRIAMKTPRPAALLLALAAITTEAAAFNGHLVTAGPLTLAMGAIPVVREFDTPVSCMVTLTNAGPVPLAVVLALDGLIDDCRAVGDIRKEVVVPAAGSATAGFQFACGRRTHAAHYPVHVRATFDAEHTRHTAAAVQIFTTDFGPPGVPAADGDPPIAEVPAVGALALAGLKTQRVAWAYAGEPLVRMAAGWAGSDPVSSANFSRGPITRGGETRPALHLHPPYRPRAGTVFAEYRLRLPPTGPIRLEFCHAIRDSTPKEGQSDGVTFRVWVDDEKLFERHTDSKSWLPGEVALDAFAGREILLRLESHPGPRNHTVCDSSYWGDPVIAVGPRPAMVGAEQRSALNSQARRLLRGNTPPGDNALVFDLAGGCRAAITPGPNGLADGAIAFGEGERQVAFAGLHLAVREHALGAWPSGAVVQAVEWQRAAPNRTRLVHRVQLAGRITELTATIWADGPALRVKVECPEPITGLGLNAADQVAPRVYYGHGYCVVEPTAFRAGAGGHNLATSHVGFDFEHGVSLLTASDTPVDHLQVDPGRHLYQLHTHPDATLTFVPGVRGAFDCAVRYRPLYDKPAAPAVARKAGRFVFDLWGGRYADHAAKLARCFDYGLTDALVILHVWQRWGYDYRLPDIFPPLPTLGTLEELRELGRQCTARGVLWGLHDNYIDIYPDATGFSYDHVTFTPEGQPRRAWLNEGREAQSYQFRPDRIRPFLDRNLGLLVPALEPTTSFVDVFASLNAFDFHDREGRFHSKRETQRAWGEAFAAIREACGGQAPTISEAGSDHLVGWLDGSDAQFLQIGPKAERFHNVVACRDWARVPWFDAVNHARFSLHGVGYSDRYQGGRSRAEHGIESDDYLSAELLTGHALMIDLPGLGRGAVRKYWLAQDFIASIARDDIHRVEFAGGDLQRPMVTWNSGARVWVNRGASDWTVEGHTLPPFGYRALHGELESAIERLGGAIAEHARAPGKYYCNGRSFEPDAPVAITPRAERLESLGGRQFRLIVNWHAQRATKRDCTVFYHFSRPTPGRRALTEFAGGGKPATPTSRWQGDVVTGEDWTITIPDDMPAGEYEILVGLHDPANRGQRERLLGDEDPRRRYRIGTLVVETQPGAGVAGTRLVPPARPFVPSSRRLPNHNPVDFGPAVTGGAFRCEIVGDQLVVTPLPDGPAFELRLRLTHLLGRPATARSVVAIDARGTSQLPVEFALQEGELRFKTNPADFAYRVEVR